MAGKQLNFNHLRYFYAIATEGSIVKAAQSLHVSPQTISGQLSIFEDYFGTKLFDRRGKQLVVNDMGKVVYQYAEEIFALGSELQQSLAAKDIDQRLVFNVGVVDVIPKILAVNILNSTIDSDSPIKLICREGDFDSLLADLAVNKLDLILSDRPLGPGLPIRAYNHFLGECGLSFYCQKEKADELRKDFPKSLHKQPFLMSGDKSSQKVNLLSWFDQEEIAPNIIAEFDDSAMMKYFGQSGYGVFCTPTMVEAHVMKQYSVEVIGRTTKKTEHFYAISPERKVKHPGVKKFVESAQSTFSTTPK